MLIAALHVVAVAAGVAHPDSADVPEPSLRAWLGLANSDDQGTRFDVRVEVLKNGVLVAEGELRCVTGVTRNPARALAVDIPISPFEESIAPGDELAVRILARIGTTPAGAFCGGHASAVGLLLYYDGAARPSSLTADVPLRRELFLRTAFGADLNDSGQIVGSASNGINTRAFLYSGGTMSDLGTLRGTNNSFARAWGINAGGDVVGLSNTADGATSHATLWSGSNIVDLGSLAGSATFSEALKINDAGQIVGRSTISAGGQRATPWEDGQIHDLGTVQGLRFSRANDINASGLIVGTASQFEGFSGRAFRWRDGTIADLNDLISSGSGWVLTSAEGLNDHGQIVGFGTRNGQTRAYLLTP